MKCTVHHGDTAQGITRACRPPYRNHTWWDGCSRRIVDFDRERAIELGAEAEKEASNATRKNHSRIEEARIIAEEMPEVQTLPAPKSLGGLLKHIESDEQESR